MAAAWARSRQPQPLPLHARAEHEQLVAAVRAALGEADFEAAWATGRAMTLDHAVALVLA